MKYIPRLLSIGLPLLFVTALSAQSTDTTHGPYGRGPGGPGGHGGPGPGRGNPIVRAIDNDGDGEISAIEIANAPSNLKSLDLNGDGKISIEDFKLAAAANGQTPPADRPAPATDTDHPRPFDPIMLALDANQDGELSASEIANATTSLKALDLNADGKLTPDEYRPTPPEGAPHHGGQPPSAG